MACRDDAIDDVTTGVGEASERHRDPSAVETAAAAPTGGQEGAGAGEEQPTWRESTEGRRGHEEKDRSAS